MKKEEMEKTLQGIITTLKSCQEHERLEANPVFRDNLIHLETKISLFLSVLNKSEGLTEVRSLKSLWKDIISISEEEYFIVSKKSDVVVTNNFDIVNLLHYIKLIGEEYNNFSEDKFVLSSEKFLKV